MSLLGRTDVREVRGRRWPIVVVAFAAALLLASAGATWASDRDGVPTAPGPSGQLSTVEGTGSLTTLFATDNNFAGNTFDLEVIGADSLMITGFEVNLDGAGNNEVIDVYWRLGSSVGVENDPASWTLLGSAPVVSAGIDMPTPVALGGLQLDPGQVYGIYVDLSSFVNGSTSSLLYTNGGPNIFANAELQLTTNTGQSDPAFNSSFFPRQWNGTVLYDIVANGPPPQEIPTLGTMGLALLALLLAACAVFLVRRRSQTA